MGTSQKNVNEINNMLRIFNSNVWYAMQHIFLLRA
jgi:hypothetical protein